MLAKALTTLALAATATLAAAAPAAADTLMTLQGHRDGFEIEGNPQPAEDASIQLWLGKDRVRRDNGKTAAILRADLSQLILVNHQA